MHNLAYYRFLAGTLPPAELGSAVLRRLQRAAVRRSWPIRPDTDVASALHLQRPEELAARMRGDRAARGPIEPNERAEARRQLAAHLPDHARALCDQADRILDGDLFLFGAWRQQRSGELAPGIVSVDWLSNPSGGARAPEAESTAIPQMIPGLDTRAIWEAGRCAHILALAQAHVVAGLPGTDLARGIATPGLYARAAALHVRDFIATQPVGQGIHWTCAMEVALRAIHLTLALMLLRDSSELDSLFWSEAATALVEHGQFIERELEDDQSVPGNHLLTDLAGLAVIGCLFPELPGALAWRERGLKAFTHELIRQSSDDGFDFESSLPYHRFATELGLLVEAIARRQALSLGVAGLARLWKMCDVVAGATLPDGRLANLGDNDSSFAVSVTRRAPLETSHVVALKAALGGPALPPSVEPEALWLGGLAGLRHNVQLAAPRLAEHSTSHGNLTAAGFVVLRGSHARAATLWAGGNGQHGLGGHAHNDKLASEIVLRGRRVVVDPGCPTYMAHLEERDRFRSTSVHPTIQVDGYEQSPIPEGRPFLLPDLAQARVVRTSEHSAWAEQRGYMRLKPPVLHRREIEVPPDIEAIRVTDWLLGHGAHVIDLRWPLASAAVSIQPAAGMGRASLNRLKALAGGQAQFDADRVFMIDVAGLAVMLAIACDQPWDAAITESVWSPGFGERVRGRTVQVRVRGQCPVALVSVFMPIGNQTGAERK